MNNNVDKSHRITEHENLEKRCLSWIFGEKDLSDSISIRGNTFYISVLSDGR